MPAVANEVGIVDVAICHHAMDFVVEVEAFVEVMTERARNRVVVELSADPPLSALNPLWKSLHGLDRPEWPVADEAEAVLQSMGLVVGREDIVLPPHTREVTPEIVEFARGRLYVGPEHDPKIETFLRSQEAQEHRVVALWWPGAAPAG